MSELMNCRVSHYPVLGLIHPAVYPHTEIITSTAASMSTCLSVSDTSWHDPHFGDAGSWCFVAARAAQRCR